MMKLIKEKPNEMYLHKQVGQGNMEDGRPCRFLMSDYGLHFKIENKDKTTTTYKAGWFEISKYFSEQILKEELKEKKNG